MRTEMPSKQATAGIRQVSSLVSILTRHFSGDLLKERTPVLLFERLFRNAPSCHHRRVKGLRKEIPISALASETYRVDEYDVSWNEPSIEGGKGFPQQFRRGSVARKSCRRWSTPAGSGVSLPSLRAVRQREVPFNETRLIYSIVKRNGRTADKATDALRCRPWQSGREITQKLTQTVVPILSRVWWEREEAKRAPPAYAGINPGRGFYTFHCRTGEG